MDSLSGLKPGKVECGHNKLASFTERERERERVLAFLHHKMRYGAGSLRVSRARVAVQCRAFPSCDCIGKKVPRAQSNVSATTHTQNARTARNKARASSPHRAVHAFDADPLFIYHSLIYHSQVLLAPRHANAPYMSIPCEVACPPPWRRPQPPAATP